MGWRSSGGGGLGEMGLGYLARSCPVRMVLNFGIKVEVI